MALYPSEVKREEEWDRLASALNQLGVNHIAPGNLAPHAALVPSTLFAELARSEQVRLQEAAIPLLLTHPDLAGAALDAISHLRGDLRDRAMRRYAAACALQRMWRTRLHLALGFDSLLPEAFLDELGLPGLAIDDGRSTLIALARQEGDRYGYNAWAGYASLMDLILAEMASSGWGKSPDDEAVGARANWGFGGSPLTGSIRDRLDRFLASLARSSGRHADLPGRRVRPGRPGTPIGNP